MPPSTNQADRPSSGRQRNAGTNAHCVHRRPTPGSAVPSGTRQRARCTSQCPVSAPPIKERRHVQGHCNPTEASPTSPAARPPSRNMRRCSSVAGAASPATFCCAKAIHGHTHRQSPATLVRANFPDIPKDLTPWVRGRGVMQSKERTKSSDETGLTMSVTADVLMKSSHFIALHPSSSAQPAVGFHAEKASACSPAVWLRERLEQRTRPSEVTLARWSVAGSTSGTTRPDNDAGGVVLATLSAAARTRYPPRP